MLFKDRLFIVTGGCSGLGAACVTNLLNRNAFVGILDLNGEAGAALEKAHPKRLKYVHCDISEDSQVQSALGSIDKAFPYTHWAGAINCAGVAMAGMTLDQKANPFDLDVFSTVIKINLIGSFNVSRLVASRIAKSHPLPSRPDLAALSKGEELPKNIPGAVTEDRGIIILTSSVSYQDGQAGQAAYASSKGGVASLALPMARDLARYGIRVVAIAPSLFDTSMGSLTARKVKENLLKSAEFPPRFGNADEFAALACHIIENEFLNGTVIRIDGATRMGKL